MWRRRGRTRGAGSAVSGALVAAMLMASSCAYVARVSVATTGEPDAASSDISLSNDGRFVAFASEATNLVSGDTNGVKDVFLRDNDAGTTVLISRALNGGGADGLSSQPRISPDGRHVVFWSFATNLVAGDTNGVSDVFVHDRSTGITERVSVDDAGGQLSAGSLGGDISDTATKIVFYTLADIAPTDTNGDFDVYVRDRSAGSTSLVSVAIDGTAAGASYEPRIAPVGDMIAWDSTAANLTTGDTNGIGDVFARSLQFGVTLSVSSGGNGASYVGDIAGTLQDAAVVFSSTASNLTPSDTDSVSDIFMFRYQNLFPSTQTISDFSTPSTQPTLSADAKRVAFSSGGDIHLWSSFVGVSLMSETIEGDPTDGDSFGASLSADGEAIGYTTLASNIGYGDTNGVADLVVHRTDRPTITSVTGELVPGEAVPITITGSLDADDRIVLEGDGVLDVTITSFAGSIMFATIELAAGQPTGVDRNIWVVRSSPALGIDYPLGAADRSTIAVGG